MTLQLPINFLTRSRQLILQTVLPLAIVTLPLTSSLAAVATNAPVPTLSAQAIAQANPIQPKSWANARLIQTIPEPESGSGSPDLLTISPDGSKIANAIGQESKEVRVWDINTGEALYTLSGHTQFLSAIAFSPNGQILATADYNFTDHLLTIRLWDVATGARIRTLVRGIAPKLYGSAFYHQARLAFSPDGQTLYSAASTPTIQVWDVNQGRLVRSLMGSPDALRALQVSPDGRTLATNDKNGQLTLLNLQSGQIIRTFDGSGDDSFNLAFSPNGQTIMSVFDAPDGTARIRGIDVWNVSTGEKIRTIEGFQDKSWIVFSPDGQTFVDAIYDGGVRFRDVETSAVEREVRSRSVNVTFSPDGQIFAAATPRGIRIWR